ncbi:sugar phosphate nucleotidyltransferase [Rubritalea tangerina]|uniref:Sugar phosphate nucleotidyltransferase n=1 Tax=Rubritalea tangerina TaxID=430798 RepID=A0ABW4Z9I8_9BACT
MSDIPKAFILGAGLGTRLRPLTENLPKPLVPYLHEPLIHQALRHCQHAGIKHCAINTHHLAHTWPQQFPQKKFENLTLEFFHEPVLLETGGGIKNIEPWIGSDPILVYNGDILTDIDLKGLIQAHQSADNIATLAVFSEGPNCNVALEGSQITDMRHSLGIHPGTHQFSGIYIIEPSILQYIPAGEKISIVPAFLELIRQGKLGAYLADGATWKDLGTREEYLAAHKTAALTHTVEPISPSASIAPEAQIDRDSCFIGPHCVIEKGAKLSNTIVWPGATVHENANLDGCIVRQSAQGTHQNTDL